MQLSFDHTTFGRMRALQLRDARCAKLMSKDCDRHLVQQQWFSTFPTAGTPVPKDVGLLGILLLQMLLVKVVVVVVCASEG